MASSNLFKIFEKIKTLTASGYIFYRILGHSNISTTTIYITPVNIDVETGMKSFKGFL